jgi:hypothetical protein
VDFVVMRFSSPEIFIYESDLKRRVLRFMMLDARLVFDYDADEVRETKRHKFQRVRWWNRLSGRDNTMPRREPPRDAIEQALAVVRSQIQYA